MTLPSKLTASILMPHLVEATLTEEHTLSVTLRAKGIDLISNSSFFVIALDTKAPKPPIKLTFTFFAASSKVLAIST